MPLLLALVCFVLVPSAIILACSFSSLQSVQIALDFDYISMAVNPMPYTTAGLYFLGFGHSFVLFPRVIQTIEFETNHRGLLHTRTQDGLPLTLGISFQYRYMPDKLIDLFISYDNKQEDVYINTAIATIANTACNYSAYSFFNDKQGIAANMQAQLDNAFRKRLFAHVEALQISRVELPVIFQDAIVHTIATKQNITQTMRYKDNMQVTFETQVMIAQQNKQVKTLAANGTANARLEIAQANAKMTGQTIAAEMQAYRDFADALGLTGSDMLNYIWWNQLQESDEQSQEFLVGVNPAAYINKV